jgi:hypothetical protein
MAPVTPPQNPPPTPPPAVVTKAEYSPLFFGPLPVRLREGYSGLVFMPDPESGAVQPPDEGLLSFSLDAGNTSYQLFQDNRNFALSDNEVQSARLTYRRGLGNGWEGAVTGALLSRNGGGLDNVIHWWHQHILGFSDPFREGNAQNTAFLQVAQNGSLLINQPNANATTGLLVLQAKKQVVARTETRHPLLAAVRSTIKIPLRSQSKSQYLDNGAVDVLLGASGSYRLGGRVWLHADVSELYAGTGKVLALQGGKRLLPQIVLAGEYALNGKTSLIAQYEDAKYPFSLNLPNHPDHRRQTSFGVWRAASSDTRFFVSFSENIAGFKVTSHAPDFQVSAGIQRRL